MFANVSVFCVACAASSWSQFKYFPAGQAAGAVTRADTGTALLSHTTLAENTEEGELSTLRLDFIYRMRH